MQLGRYQILRKIADGGMARVYAARVSGASGFEKLVAIKQMLPEISPRPDMRRMFLDEARVAANIRSPHVVSTFDLGEAEDGSPYIVMDLVLGCTVSEITRAFAKEARHVPLTYASSSCAKQPLACMTPTRRPRHGEPHCELFTAT